MEIEGGVDGAKRAAAASPNVSPTRPQRPAGETDVEGGEHKDDDEEADDMEQGIVCLPAAQAAQPNTNQPPAKKQHGAVKTYATEEDLIAPRKISGRVDEILKQPAGPLRRSSTRSARRQR